MDSTHNFAKAKRLWRLGDFYTAKKNIIHGIRYLNYSIQLLGPDEAITDFTVGNEYWDEIMNSPEPTEAQKSDTLLVQQLWKHLDVRFAPIYKKLTDRMKEMCDEEMLKAQEWEARWISKRFGVPEKKAALKAREVFVPVDILLDFIREFGLNMVSKWFGVVVSRHSSIPNLVILSRTQHANLELHLVQWCSGVVVDENKNMEVVAMPFPKVFATTSTPEVLPIFDWTNPKIRVEEHFDGVKAMVYFYNGRWHVSSAESADGSELTGWVNPIRLANWKDFVIEGFNFNPVHQSKMLLQFIPGETNPTFAQHFWDSFLLMGYSTEMLREDHIFIFELCSPLARNIVEYENVELVLLGVRDMKNGGRELPIETVTQQSPLKRIPSKFFVNPATSLLTTQSDPNVPSIQPTADILHSSLRFCDPLVTEGYMLRYPDGRRLAFRSPQFLSLDRLHPLSDQGQVQKLLLELVRSLAPRHWTTRPRFSVWLPKFEPIDAHYQAVCRTIQATWDEVLKIFATQGQAGCAAFLSNKPIYASEIFHLLKLDMLKTTIAEHFSRMHLKKLQTLLRRMAEEIGSQSVSTEDANHKESDPPSLSASPSSSNQ
jgi:hypothetical protein